MNFKIPPSFDLTTFTKREEKPIRIRVGDVETHAQDAIARANKAETIFARMLTATLAEIHNVLGDEPQDPDEILAGGLCDRALAAAFIANAETPSGDVEFETMQCVVHFVAIETARLILIDLLGEDLHAKAAAIGHSDPEFNTIADIIDGLEAKIRHEYWFP